ncbi:MAG: hypothetical protein ACRDGA_11180, partial [Bacteroidota bacterium]
MTSLTALSYTKLLFASFLCLLFSDLATGQERQEVPPGFSSALIQLNPHDTLYQLPSEFLLTESESVFLDSTTLLASGVHYTVDYRFGRVIIPRKTLDEVFADSLGHALFIVYKALPFAFKPEYSLRQKVVAKDTASGREITFITPVQKSPFDDLFGPGLRKSGSLTRGFTVGSNRDLSLTSGFRMQLAGNLAQNVDIVAALTDENTPIQPEGTTQTLREVDKVFVELKAPRYSATLGDFNFEQKGKEGGEFGRLSRKLQGATVSVQLFPGSGTQPAATLMAAGATQRGKFHTNLFQGVEGNQGPFQLTGRNGERRIIVVAGSERVYLNGEVMTRGEVNDYTVDYASGQIFFTSRRLITNASRVTIDFEYSDLQFSRNLLAGGVTTSLSGDNVKFNALFTQEADDPDSPVEGMLDDATRAKLSESGADRFKASLPGERFVGRDLVTGIGLGQYVRKDTVIGGRGYAIFVYSPGDSLAVYAVSFSTVDRMPSDSAGYLRIGVGQFRFAGIGQGNYLPIQFLPMPQVHRVVDLNASASISSDFLLTGEYAVSHFDQNRLSAVDNQGQTGSALKFGLQFSPRNVTIGGSNLGDVDLSLSERYVDRRFVSLDRYNEIEFGRKWNLESATGGDEEISEANLSFRPREGITVAAGYGLLKLQNTYRSTRLQTDVALRDSARNGIQYQREDISSTNVALNESSRWTRQRGNAEYVIWKVRPGLRVESEERLLSSSMADSLRAGSFQFSEISPRLSVELLTGLRAATEFQIRDEDSVATGTLQRASTSLTQVYTAELQASPLTSSLALNIRKTKFTELFQQRGNTDSDVILVRSQSRYVPLERALDVTLFYEFANQRAARLERVFLRVPQGTGNYRYKGDLNGNGIADEDEFEPTRFDGDYVVIFAPSDQLFPVLDLKTSVRLRLEPARLVRQPTGVGEKILHALSSETLFRVEEKSTEQDA